ncbi:hypothetical protein [Pedobacter hartonius]|nr:hypothetical protein [Pedobacter hartonius]
MSNMHELGKQRAFELGIHSMPNFMKMEDCGRKSYQLAKNTWLPLKL